MWARSLGYPKIQILSDFNPHGAVSRSYGAWIDADGTPDRATVIVDAHGMVVYAVSVGKGGKRDMNELLRLARG